MWIYFQISFTNLVKPSFFVLQGERWRWRQKWAWGFKRRTKNMVQAWGHKWEGKIHVQAINLQIQIEIKRKFKKAQKIHLNEDIFKENQERSSSKVHEDASDSSQFHEEIQRMEKISNVKRYFLTIEQEIFAILTNTFYKPRFQAWDKDDEVTIVCLLQ